MEIKKIPHYAIKYISDKAYRFGINSYFGFYNKMSDLEFVKKEYLYEMHEELDLNNPSSFNEKLQWLKVYDHKNKYTNMVDKIAAKKYVADLIGEEYIIPTIGVWNKPEDIEWSRLPNQFVLKTSHDSGSIVICRDKDNANRKRIIRKLRASLKRDYYLVHREWPYKNVPRRILAEKFMGDNDQVGLTDYKFYCFNGTPRFLYVSQGLENHRTAKISFLTLDWQFTDFSRSDYQPFESLPQKPDNLSEMIEIAKALSKDTSFLRVDLYSINGNTYFSELTFCPCGGMMPFSPRSADEQIGKLLQLPTTG